MQQSKYLSMPKQGADIGTVAEDDLQEEVTTIGGVSVVGVMSLETYFSCLGGAHK